MPHPQTLSPVLERPATTIAEAADPSVLAAIARPGTALAIWQRALPEGLADWLAALPVAQLPALWCKIDAAHAADAVLGACAEVGLGEAPEARLLARDVAALARHMAGVSGRDRISLRLKVVRDDSCRRFHVDAMRLRMLCSYRGAGTQYGVGRPGGADPAPIRQMRPGDVATLRGSAWRGEDAPCGIIHRSPPMQPGDDTRFLLVIDPVDPDCDCC